MIEVDFGENLLDKLVAHLEPGQALSAAAVLTALEAEEGAECFVEMDILEIPLDISDLPKAAGVGEAALRLRQEEQLAKEGNLLSGLEENDPLRLYLEEIAAMPACGDENALALELLGAAESKREDRKSVV